MYQDVISFLLIFKTFLCVFTLLLHVLLFCFYFVYIIMDLVLIFLFIIDVLVTTLAYVSFCLYYYELSTYFPFFLIIIIIDDLVSRI